MAADHHVFQYGHILKKTDVLKGPGQPPFRYQVGFEAIDALGFSIFCGSDQDIPGARFVNPGNTVEKRRLARTVGADQGHDFTLTDIQVDLVQRPQAAEIHCQLFYVEYRFHMPVYFDVGLNNAPSDSISLYW